MSSVNNEESHLISEKDQFAQFFAFGDDGRNSRNNSTARSVIADDEEHEKGLFNGLKLDVVSPPRTRPVTPDIAQKAVSVEGVWKQASLA